MKYMNECEGKIIIIYYINDGDDEEVESEGAMGALGTVRLR